MTRHPPQGAAVAELDPAQGLIAATDTELGHAWAQLEQRILNSLGPDWIITRSGTHHGYDVLACSRLHVIAIGVLDNGHAQLVVDFCTDLEPSLRARIHLSAQSTGALIFERLARFAPVHVVQAHAPQPDASEAA